MCGLLGLIPAGGVTWDYLQYPLGLHELGHDVFYIEDTALWPIYQPNVPGDDCTSNIRHLSAVMASFGLSDRWAYRDDPTATWYGMSQRAVAEVCHTADVLINVSCSMFLREEYRRIPCRVLIDSDPMFTQIQCQTAHGVTTGSGALKQGLMSHTHHFTFGENIGASDCRIPDCGVTWRPTRQPICLNHWPVAPPPTDPSAAMTTLMNWRAGNSLEYSGESWGQKDVEFTRFIDLPRRTPWARLALAAGRTTGHPVPAADLQAAGWVTLEPEACAADWRQYRRFIQASRGEFSVAKQTYVKAATGWFSGRSACYLASGRPVVVQETGWSRYLPSTEGALPFGDVASAVDALGRVYAEPERHARAARQIADECFDSRRVLGDLLNGIGA